jgi:hypothetical protein
MSNVANYFSLPTSTDNALVLGGTVQTGGSENLKKTFLNVCLTDISSASTVYVTSPVAGTITKIYSIIDGAIATADAVITSKIGAVAITGGAITIANSSSAAGDVDSATPTAANTVAAGSNINLTTNGASTNTVKAVFTIEITRS